MFLKSYSKCSACRTNVGLVAILTRYLVDTFTDILWSVLRTFHMISMIRSSISVNHSVNILLYNMPMIFNLELLFTG